MMTLLTDFNPDPDIQYQIGYKIIAVTGLNVLGNNVLIAYKTYKKLRLSIRRLKARIQAMIKRMKQKIEARKNRVQKYEAPNNLEDS
jgi:hypothetical protein